jgi:hypothetical protein
MRIVFPDPLIWQSGIEFGLQAVGEFQREERPVKCLLRDRGPMLEAVTFAALQYGLLPMVEWTRHWPHWLRPNDVAVFPRVAPGDAGPIQEALRQNATVITSDPGIVIQHALLRQFPRRDVAALVQCLVEVRAQSRETPLTV